MNDTHLIQDLGEWDYSGGSFECSFPSQRWVAEKVNEKNYSPVHELEMSLLEFEAALESARKTSESSAILSTGRTSMLLLVTVNLVFPEIRKSVLPESFLAVASIVIVVLLYQVIAQRKFEREFGKYVKRHARTKALVSEYLRVSPGD